MTLRVTLALLIGAVILGATAVPAVAAAPEKRVIEVTFTQKSVRFDRAAPGAVLPTRGDRSVASGTARNNVVQLGKKSGALVGSVQASTAFVRHSRAAVTWIARLPGAPSTPRGRSTSHPPARSCGSRRERAPTRVRRGR